jgi:hypothetical protein
MSTLAGAGGLQPLRESMVTLPITADAINKVQAESSLLRMTH